MPAGAIGCEGVSTVPVLCLESGCISASCRIQLDRSLVSKDESGVSPVSKRYMRAGIGNDRLVVCLSAYLP